MRKNAKNDSKKRKDESEGQGFKFGSRSSQGGAELSIGFAPRLKRGR